MNYNKISQVLYTISIGILTVLTIFILFMSINLNNANFFSTFLYGYKVPIFILFCSAFLFSVLYMIIHALSKYKLVLNEFFPYIILFLISLLQIFFIFKMQSSLRYDTLKIFDEAISLLNDGTISPEYSSGYFAKYPNNIPLCVITCLLLKIPKLFGLSRDSYMIYVQIINVLMIDISFFFSYKLLGKVKNEKLGIIFVLLCLFNPLTYLIAPYYYTHTFSMAFSTGAIYFFVCCMQKETTMKIRLFFSFLTGLLISIGFKIRATVIIIPIACFIYLLLNIKLINKKSLYIFAAFFGALILGFTSYHFIEKNYVKFDYTKTGYPATHWIMLGMQGTGSYNPTDDAYTEAFATKDERTAATESVIVQRLKDMGVPGLVKLWKNKLEITWSDGTDDFIDNVSMTAKYGIKNDLISGSQNDLLVAYCHIYHFMILLLMFICILLSLVKNPDNLMYIVSLNLLGGIIFHLIWESGEVYNVSFSCSILALAAEGFYITSNHLDSIKTQKVRPILFASITLMSIFSIGYVGSKLTKLPYTHYDYAVKQDLAEPDTTLPLLDGTVLCQTFKTERAFNTIGVKVRNSLGSDNCSSYKFQLLSSNNEILVESDIIGAWAFDKDYYRVEFNTITPTGDEEFKFKIIPNIVSDVHSLTFQSYDTGNYDIYQDGVLFKNDIATDADLTFIVLNKIDGAFIGN